MLYTAAAVALFVVIALFAVQLLTGSGLSNALYLGNIPGSYQAARQTLLGGS